MVVSDHATASSDAGSTPPNSLPPSASSDPGHVEDDELTKTEEELPAPDSASGPKEAFLK
jgi:hypothetical protein